MTDSRLASIVGQVLVTHNDPEARNASTVGQVLVTHNNPEARNASTVGQVLLTTKSAPIWDGQQWQVGKWRIWNGTAWVTSAFRQYPIEASAVENVNSWNNVARSLGPTVWLKLDETTRTAVCSDSSGNSYDFVYDNGTYAPADIPQRGRAPLVNGSLYSARTYGGGNNEIRSATTGAAVTAIKALIAGGSWTFGGFVQTTTTSSAPWAFGINQWNCAGSLNFNGPSYVAQSGTISMWFDHGGTNANSLAATSTGWNDGNVHALFFEYDSVADTISIWLDGTRIATRARAGTKPVLADFVAGTMFSVKDLNGITDMGVDEFLIIPNVLTADRHALIASYAY